MIDRARANEGVNNMTTTQIPIDEAVEYLLGTQREYTNYTECRARYYRKLTQAEARAKYNLPDDGKIVIGGLEHYE